MSIGSPCSLQTSTQSVNLQVLSHHMRLRKYAAQECPSLLLPSICHKFLDLEPCSRPHMEIYVHHILCKAVQSLGIHTASQCKSKCHGTRFFQLQHWRHLSFPTRPRRLFP